MVLGNWFGRPASAAQPGLPTGGASTELERQGLLDLAKRADRGIFVHLPLWLLIAGWSELFSQQPLFCAINAGIFLANAICRSWLRPHFGALVQRNYRWARRVYLALLLANCAHWGLLTGAAVVFPALHAAEVPLLFAAVGVACS